MQNNKAKTTTRPTISSVASGIPVQKASNHGGQSIKTENPKMFEVLLNSLKGLRLDTSKISDVLYVFANDFLLAELVLTDGTTIPLEGTIDETTNKIKLLDTTFLVAKFKLYAAEGMESLHPIYTSSLTLPESQRIRAAILELVKQYYQTGSLANANRGMYGGRSKKSKSKSKTRKHRKHNKKQTKRKHKKQH